MLCNDYLCFEALNKQQMGRVAYNSQISYSQKKSIGKKILFQKKQCIWIKFTLDKYWVPSFLSAVSRISWIALILLYSLLELHKPFVVTRYNAPPNVPTFTLHLKTKNLWHNAVFVSKTRSIHPLLHTFKKLKPFSHVQVQFLRMYTFVKIGRPSELLLNNGMPIYMQDLSSFSTPG